MMKEEVIELDTVDKYNKFFKVETYHPMVTVVDLSKLLSLHSHLP